MSSTRKMIIVAVVILAFMLLAKSAKAQGLFNYVIDISGELPKSSTDSYVLRSLSEINRIIIHHTAGPKTQTPRDIALYHTSANHICENGCPGIAYHYLITSGGTIYKVNKLETVSYHVKGYNTGSIGICFIGDYDNEEPGREQINALKWLLKNIYQKLEREIPLYGHRDYRSTSCPGEYMQERLIKEGLIN